ncbi:hypothetical protein [Aliamphritea spongicola]|uniref:hypothetical protein n=1 Tax=Aliamphritea spongicola TaxID=707589 RepID=UPI00196AF248|nr:hypothetical protein [Aliamphritea spongicola]MBN3562999.1 hypothetical protein [Aliamphritea spongicola]
MEENRFFKLVWRFNGLIISVAGVLAIGMLIFFSYKLLTTLTRERNTRNTVNIEENTEIRENWRLGTILAVDNAKTLIIPLHSNQRFEGSYYNKAASSTRNYLFINTDTFKEKWLFDHTNYLIERSDRLKQGDRNSKEPVIAILYQLVKLDSDQDNRLSAADLSTIAITRPDGSDYKELITEVQSITNHIVLNETELFLFYKKDNASYSAIINLKKGQVMKTNQVPAIGSERRI